MTDIEDNSHMPPQRDMRFGDWNACQIRKSCRRCSGIEMIVEVIHGFLRGFQEAKRFGFERKPDRASRAPGDIDEARCNFQYMIRVAGDHVRSCDPGFESKRRTLNGR